MRKLFSIFAIVTLVALIGCKESGVPQEDYDKLEKELTDAQTLIAQLEDDLEACTLAWEECDSILNARKISYTGKKPPVTTTTTTTTPTVTDPKPTDRNPTADPKDRNDGGSAKSPEGQKQRN